MGVEYQHFLIPAKPDFIASGDILVKIDAMLERWKLKSGEPKIIDLTNGINQLVNGTVASVSFNHGLVLHYPDVETAAIETVFGESCFGNERAAADRYLKNIFLVVGTDYRVHPEGETIAVTVTSPPANGSTLISPYNETGESYYDLYAAAYEATAETTAPVTMIDFYGTGDAKKPANFYGFWRAALIFDFGKDLPKLEDDWFSVPNKSFMADVEKAFGTALAELGQVY